MFDTVLGIPVHPLVVHAVVVLGPLTALLLVIYAVVPRVRAGLRWPLLLLALVSAGSAWVAQEAGEALMAMTYAPGFNHQERGEMAWYALLALLAATVVVVVLAPPRARDTYGASASGSAARTGIAVVLALAAAGFAVTTVVLAGHSGAESVWTPKIATVPTSEAT